MSVAVYMLTSAEAITEPTDCTRIKLFAFDVDVFLR
jgi:hypothetical protein